MTKLAANTTNATLGELFTRLDTEGYRFRIQGPAGDIFVDAAELADDLTHGDMAEMLNWPAIWDGAGQCVIATAPPDAVEAPSVPVVFPVWRE